MKRYADDYENVRTVDERGREKTSVVYRGEYFNLDLDKASLKSFRTLMIALTLVMVALLVGAGFLPSRGLYLAYVAIPYVVCYFPLLYLLTGVVRLPRESAHLRRDEVGLSFDRIRTTSLLLMIFLGIGFLGQIAFLIFLSGGEALGWDLLLLLLQALVLGSAVVIFIRTRKINVRLEDNPEGV